MSRYVLKTKKDYFNLMNKNIKTLDIRVGYPQIRRIKVGDTIKFKYFIKVIFEVVKITRYNNFSDLLDNEDISLILPYKTRDEIYDILESRFPKEKQELGIYVFKLKRIDKFSADI